MIPSLTKKQKIQAGLIILMIVGTCVFGLLFKTNYDRFMSEGGSDAEERVAEIEKNDKTPLNAGSVIRTPVKVRTLLIYGGLFLVFGAALGLTTGRYVSGVIGEKVATTLQGGNSDVSHLMTVDYEKAEEAWANENYLEAIELFRDYLKERPNEVHASIRIAEIYEKDLNNPVASAMEYEDILKHPLPDELWGKTAIHLCNIYITKLNRPTDALALMKRIAREYEFTNAAVKARQHLERMGESYENGIQEEEPAPKTKAQKAQKETLDDKLRDKSTFGFKPRK